MRRSLSQPHPRRGDDGNARLSHTGWLGDEIRSRLTEIVEFDSGGNLGNGFAKQIERLYRTNAIANRAAAANTI